MIQFNELQKTIIKSYISRDLKLLQRIYNPEIHDERLSIIFDDVNMTKELRELATEALADGEIIAKVYYTLKQESRLKELFTSEQPIVHTDLTVNEWNLIFDYLGKVYESNEVMNHQCALDELAYLIETESVWKLFENEAYVDFLKPNFV